MSADLTAAIRASLSAKRARLLARPIVARIEGTSAAGSLDDQDQPAFLRALRRTARELDLVPTRTPWAIDAETGECSVRIAFDYEDVWLDREREIIDELKSAKEGGEVVFLTDEQRQRLERSPEHFLELRHETTELISFHAESIGGSLRVTELTTASGPQSPEHIRHVAILPNTVQLDRQLEGLRAVETARDDSPLAPLRALIGAWEGPLPCGSSSPTSCESPVEGADVRLDEHQRECIEKALGTPHFAVIQGPPGSGKTTVICEVVRRALARGERVLVVSPTHVAVDNVVEKLAQLPKSDLLWQHTLPVRWATRSSRLSQKARDYWVGSKDQRRLGTIASRVERTLAGSVPFAEALFALQAEKTPERAPVSSAIAGLQSVVCGTPIGILSSDAVKDAPVGEFGLLVVDEVSKMTLPEFLAVAVKARRWVLVGDPEQLPPFNDCEENAWTLDDVFDPVVELACSVGALLDRAHPSAQPSLRLVVAAAEPVRASMAIRSHLLAVMPTGKAPPVGVLGEAPCRGVVVCSPEEIDQACERLSPLAGHDRTHDPDSAGSIRILCERGLKIPRPTSASGRRLVEEGHRAQAMLFENAYGLYHTYPWSRESQLKLRVVRRRNGFNRYLPSTELLAALQTCSNPAEDRVELMRAAAQRVAINAVSVYDLLTRIQAFDTEFLNEIESASQPGLRDAVKPFVGTLKKQYRMHSSLSRVPRELFYFGAALHDGRPDKHGGCGVEFIQIPGAEGASEENPTEARKIFELLEGIKSDLPSSERVPHVMIITPYRAQEALLARELKHLRHVHVEVCTLDRCQGREAEYVFVSLVKGRATAFMDMPKRWNVALTRAKTGLLIVGDTDAYLAEARQARRQAARGEAPVMSLLARVVEAYETQLSGDRRASA